MLLKHRKEDQLYQLSTMNKGIDPGERLLKMIGIVNSSFLGLLGLAYHREVVGLVVLHIGCVNNTFTGAKSVSGIISRGREISSKVLNMKTVMIYNHGNRIHKLRYPFIPSLGPLRWRFVKYVMLAFFMIKYNVLLFVLTLFILTFTYIT